MVVVSVRGERSVADRDGSAGMLVVDDWELRRAELAVKMPEA